MVNRRTHRLLLLLPFLLLVGCNSDSGLAPAIGEAYVGPATLELDGQLGPRPTTVAVLKQGEHVDILARRRRFVKVRDSSGVEGWTDERLLMTPQQMLGLRRFSEMASELPSQGTATTFDRLNVHPQPHRAAPSFFQITDRDRVEVIGHRLVPLLPYQPDGQVVEDNVPDSVLREDWNLVRAVDGKSGWALSRMLVISVPQEVAQYAQGRRITSYFPLGETLDDGQVKQNWLWTSISGESQPYEFDSFQVFVWNSSRDRYETARIERKLKGYYPVEVHTAETQEGKVTSKSPSFSVIVEDEDGLCHRRTYALQGYRVQMVNQSPHEKPSPISDYTVLMQQSDSEDAQSQSFFGRLRNRLSGLFGELSRR